MSDTTARFAVVTTDYPVGLRPYATTGDGFWTGSEEQRTFLALPAPPDDLTGWHILIVPTSDPRHNGMRAGNEQEREALSTAGLDAEEHLVWSIEDRYLTFAEDAAPLTPLTFGDLAVGELWQSAGAGGANDGPWIKLPGSRYAKVGNLSVGSTMHDDYPVKRYVLPSGDVTPEREEEIRRDQRNKDLAQFQEWKNEATRVAHEYAAANGLCSEFDRAMRDIGLPDRSEYSLEREYEVTIVREYRVTVTASNDDEAYDSAYSVLPYSENAYDTSLQSVELVD